MIAWFDCFAGISGDMVLGAMVDAGWPEQNLKALPGLLGLEGVTVSITRVLKKGIEAVSVKVEQGDAQPMRTLPVIEQVIEASNLDMAVKQKVVEIFALLAQAEARVHGCPVEKVHFHEIGAADTIIDIAGSVQAVHELGIKTCFCSPLPAGRGFARCAHGLMPLPAPAVSVLLEGVPVYGVEIEGELVTPTGAAIVRGLCSDFGMMPAMTVGRTGCGAGDMDLEGIPNLLRVWTGDDGIEEHSRISRLSTCVDDMNPEWFPHVMEKLLAAGALDVFIRPVYMKKGRAGNELVVLSATGMEDALRKIIFSETTTTGIRFSSEARYLLPRRLETVDTPWGPVGVKVITRPDGQEEAVPEYEQCARVAREHGVPLVRVYKTVTMGGSSLRINLENQKSGRERA